MRWVVIESRWKDRPNPDGLPPMHPAVCREVEQDARPRGGLTVDEYHAELAKTDAAAAPVSARIKARAAQQARDDARANDPTVRMARMVAALAAGKALTAEQRQDLAKLSE